MYLGEGRSGRQLRKALIEDYPYLQPRRMSDGQVSPDYDYEFIVGEYDLPEGWLALFLQMCEDIKAPLEKAGLLNDFRFLQVKEKYGQLRAYNTGVTDEVNNIIDKYEFLSEQVCSTCGKPAIAMTRGWICPFCEEHIKEFTERGENVDPIEVQTCYVRKLYHNGEHTETVINCWDEWHRYLTRIGYKTVYVIEKLVDISTGKRELFSRHYTESDAKTRLDKLGCIQQVVLADGSVVPEFVVTKCDVSYEGGRICLS